MNAVLHEKKNHIRYYMLMAVIFLMVILRNIVEIPIPLASFLVVGFALCLTSTREEIVAFICSMAPFEMTFQFRYMLLIGVFFLLIKSRRYKIQNLIPILLIIFWDFLHYFNQSFSFYDFRSSFAVFITLGVILIIEPLDYSDGLSVRSISLTTLFSCIMTIIIDRNLTGYTILTGERLGSTHDLSESFNVSLNPNTGSFLCVLCICGLVLLRWRGNNKKTDMPLAILLMVFVLLFQSKSALLCLLLVIIIYYFANNKNWILSTIRIFGMLLALFIAGFTVFRSTMINFLMRFTVDDISTGRFAIFAFYHKFWISDLKNIFYGVGLFDYNIKIASQYSSRLLELSGAATYLDNQVFLMPSHNNIQEILIVWGVFGLFLMIWLLFIIVKHKKMERKIIHYLPLSFILLYTLQGQLVSSSVVLIGLIFSLVCLEYQDDNLI